MKNHSTPEPNLAFIRLTQAVVHFLDGMVIASRGATEQEKSLLEYQAVTLMNSVVRLHSTTARLTQGINRLTRKEESPETFDKSAPFPGPGEIANLIQERFELYCKGSPDPPAFRPRISESLKHLQRFYSGEQPVKTAANVEENKGNAPNQQSSANVAPVLLIPQDIIKIKIGNQTYQKKIK